MFAKQLRIANILWQMQDLQGTITAGRINHPTSSITG
jgi:hypothetical protein